MKDGLLYLKTDIGPTKEPIWHFVVPREYRMTAVNGCHHEAGHQGQKRSKSLMIERFWWPGMCKELINQVKTCARCRMYEASSDKADLQKIIASAPGEILHIDFTSIEETVELQTKPVIRNVLVLQDHFSKYWLTATTTFAAFIYVGSTPPVLFSVTKLRQTLSRPYSLHQFRDHPID